MRIGDFVIFKDPETDYTRIGVIKVFKTLDNYYTVAFDVEDEDSCHERDLKSIDISRVLSLASIGLRDITDNLPRRR